MVVIVRTRNMDIINKCDIVVDVGGIYDVETYANFVVFISSKRFDHHQKGFFEVFSDNHATKLSSAGLVYFSSMLFIVDLSTMER